MAPLGNFIRLTPLQLDELPSHPALETRFRRSFSKIGRKNCIQPNDNTQALEDVSNASRGIPKTQPVAPGIRPLDLDDDSDAPTENPKPLKNTLEITQNNLHSGVTSGTSTPGIFDDTGRPNLFHFIKAILDEATTFIDIDMPRTFFEGGLKSSFPSTAKVRLLKRTISGTELSQIPWEKSAVPREMPRGIQKSSEAWFARSSTHANQSLVGTANCFEFDTALRIDHSQHEREYTPDVFDDFKVLEWDLGSSPDELVVDNYRHVTMGIYEMCHKLPFPMVPRVFPVLVITAKTGAAEFIVVQIPVNLESLPEAFYSNGRNLKEGRSALQRKKPVLGYIKPPLDSWRITINKHNNSVYTSIERCLLDEHRDYSSKSKTNWVMATASDAKGWLPLWMQKLGVPGAVVKDVGLVIKWLHENRGKNLAYSSSS